jgi:hypothetical protein
MLGSDDGYLLIAVRHRGPRLAGERLNGVITMPRRSLGTGETPRRRPTIGHTVTPPSVDRFCGGLVPIVWVAPCKCDKPIER